MPELGLFRSPDVARRSRFLGKFSRSFSLSGLDMGLCRCFSAPCFYSSCPCWTGLPRPGAAVDRFRGAVYFFGILTILFRHFLLLTTQGATGFLYFRF